MQYPDSWPRGKFPTRLGLGFGLELGLVLGLGAILLGGNCPKTIQRTLSNIVKTGSKQIK